MLSFVIFRQNISILWKSSWIFIRAKASVFFLNRCTVQHFCVKNSSDVVLLFFNKNVTNYIRIALKYFVFHDYFTSQIIYLMLCNLLMLYWVDDEFVNELKEIIDRSCVKDILKRAPWNNWERKKRKTTIGYSNAGESPIRGPLEELRDLFCLKKVLWYINGGAELGWCDRATWSVWRAPDWILPWIFGRESWEIPCAARPHECCQWDATFCTVLNVAWAVSEATFFPPVAVCTAHCGYLWSCTEVLSGTCGTILSNILGDDAELCGLLSITSRPGCPAQSMHSDGMWSESSPRLITMFLAVHNILDEAQGPTLFITQTHRPDCFAGERWLPPTDELVSQRDPIWFKLKAGDIVLMDQTTWHCGGANTSDQMRTLLSFSFVARSGPMSNDKLRLGDFRNGWSVTTGWYIAGPALVRCRFLWALFGGVFLCFV